MTDEELDAIEARAKAATPGPWENDGGRVWTKGEAPLVYVCNAKHGLDGPRQTDPEPDAEFIAAARSDVPALVAEVRRLRVLLANRSV